MKEAIAMMLSLFFLTSALGAGEEETILSQFTCKAEPEENPLDLGHILVPPSIVVLPIDGTLKLEGKITNTSSTERKLSLEITSSLKDIGKEEELVLPSKQSITINERFSFPSGSHSLKLALREEGKTLEEKQWRIIVEKRGEFSNFGAVYCDLTYDYPVLFYKDGKFEKRDWKEVWRNGPYSDVLVRFPNGARLAFWRGTSYIPIWAFQKSAFSYEWVEVISPRPPEFVDCIEPLMDKECRYSRVAIVHNSPARVLIHWRYALSDFNYRIYENEWVDEYYYLYPDGIGVRTIVGWLAPGVKHEMNELITILPPAVHPNDVLPSNAVDFLDLNGNKQAITWPQPRLNWSTGLPSIVRVKLKEKYHPIMVVPAISEFTAVWDGWKNEKGEYVSPCYWGNHWPVTRNLQTVGHIPVGWEEGPAHASLISMIHQPLEEEDISPSIHKTVWAHLIGAVKEDEGDEKLLLVASSWLKPAEVESRTQGIEAKGFDILQRAYVFDCHSPSHTITIRLTPKDKLLNPAFLFLNLEGEVKEVSLGSEVLETKDYRWGIEEEGNGKNLVIWLERMIERPEEVRIELK